MEKEIINSEIIASYYPRTCSAVVDHEGKYFLVVLHSDIKPDLVG